MLEPGRPRSAPIATDVPRQASFDELGERLADLTFVVVDLETTGGSAATCAITEIGAVKVRGGAVLGEFQTLVNPGAAIPPFIAVLTGITDTMVATSPPADVAVPAFLDWAGDAVFVAHNAPFDLGFLRAACERTGRAWPQPRSVDTARLARRVLSRDEAPDCRLATLSRLFRTATEPCHRALADARATVDVLHGLFERLGPLGVQTWEELRTFTGLATAAARRKRHLADGLPDGPGVYVFRDGAGRPLYVGRSRALRQRVRQYFTASEPRSRMAEMVGIAERVDAIPCSHDLEAQVREVRLIGELKPRYNRRSKFPERGSWLVLTREPFPRLSVVHRQPPKAEVQLGPFPSARAAAAAAAAVYDAVPLRQCTQRIPVVVRRPAAACALAGMGRCSAPCEGGVTVEQYGPVAAAAAEVLTGDVSGLLAAAQDRLDRLSAQQRYEEAAAVRDRTAGFVRSAVRTQRLAALTDVPEIIAARPASSGGWEVAVVRHATLAAAGRIPPGAAPGPYVFSLRESAEAVDPPAGRLVPQSAEEADLILKWLVAEGTRLVSVTGTWAARLAGAERAARWADRLSAAAASASPLDDRRRLRPVSRPARITA